MTTSPLQPSTIVWLNSGGPSMTVRRMRGDDYAEVIWRTEKGIKFDVVPSVCLTVTDPGGRASRT